MKDVALDFVELWVPMAKPVVYWHAKALGFNVKGYLGPETGSEGVVSYYLTKGDVNLVISAAYAPAPGRAAQELLHFTGANGAGVKRIGVRVPAVREAFDAALRKGAVPVQFPTRTEGDGGYVEEAAIRLYDHNEIVFTDRSGFRGLFKPGYRALNTLAADFDSGIAQIDHIASELRINQIDHWSRYLGAAIGTQLVQSIPRSEDNRTGMVLNINQTPDRNITLVMAEPSDAYGKSKVQQNIDRFGPGIHHLAFATDDLVATVGHLKKREVDFVGFPDSYYDLLREDDAFAGFDIDALQQAGILVDKEDDTYLLQKFIKPFGDRPFFLYELVQRVNGYNGFALKNINVLKRAEEREIMKVAKPEAV